MNEIFGRTEKLIGKDAVLRLKDSHVAVFGLGGVGGACAEALCRAGVGHLSIFDGDRVSPSNINRQIIATCDTVGENKTDACEKRLLSINPDVKITKHSVFFTKENALEFDLSQYDFIVDAVDMVSAKIELAVLANEKSVPLISSMGTGNKLDPTAFEITDLFKTSVCPLARVMRRELKARGIKKLRVLYSKEEPRKPLSDDVRTPASISFVPPVAGMIIAGDVIKSLALLED